MRRNSEWWLDCFREDAGEKFRAMDDRQFSDYKRANPGAASKAQKLRDKPNAQPKPQSTPKPNTTSTAITKPEQKALPGSTSGAIQKKETEEKKTTVGPSEPMNKGQQSGPKTRKQSKPTTPQSQKMLPPGKDQPKPKSNRDYGKWARRAGDAYNFAKSFSHRGGYAGTGTESKDISGGVKASGKNISR